MPVEAWSRVAVKSAGYSELRRLPIGSPVIYVDQKSGVRHWGTILGFDAKDKLKRPNVKVGNAKHSVLFFDSMTKSDRVVVPVGYYPEVAEIAKAPWLDGVKRPRRAESDLPAAACERRAG
ncbi:MAG: hypothetical protein ACYCRD_04600 [Leptospirillum sp.]